MSADLRSAAQLIREYPGNVRGEAVADALAELLDRHAAQITEWAEATERDGDLTETEEAAIAVAEAILRGES